MRVRRLKAMQDVLDKMRGDRHSSSSYQEPLPLQCEPQAAEYLGVTPRALQAWRYRGGGPRYVRISARAIWYRQCDLDAWILERLHNEASEYRT